MTAGGGIRVNARFVAINRRLGGLANPIELKPSICCSAESDGFIFGLIKAATLRWACIAAPVRRFDYYHLKVLPETLATAVRLQFFPLHRH